MTHLEVGLLNSGADLVLVSQMVKSGIKRWWVIHEVDGHVQCVEDTHGVGRESWSLRMFDVDSFEEFRHVGHLLSQPAYRFLGTPCSVVGPQATQNFRTSCNTLNF